MLVHKCPCAIHNGDVTEIPGLLLALVALLDGHGIPGAVFGTPAVATYLGGAAANALLEAWPADEPVPWAADRLRANVASLHDSAADVLWADGCHPLLLRAGQSLDEARLVGPAVAYWRDLATRL